MITNVDTYQMSCQRNIIIYHFIKQYNLYSQQFNYTSIMISNDYENLLILRSKAQPERKAKFLLRF